MRPPISDVSSPDHAPERQLPAADRQAERRRGAQGARLGGFENAAAASAPPRRRPAASGPATTPENVRDLRARLPCGTTPRPPGSDFDY